MGYETKLSRRAIVGGAGASATLGLSGLPFGTGAAPRSDAGDRVVTGVIRRVDAAGAGGAVGRARAEGQSGVMVSNGRDVTVSGSDGVWALAAVPGEFISIIKPSGWRTVDHVGVATDTWFKRVTDTTDKPIDFYLAHDPEPARFDVLLVADTQAANALELEFVHRELVPAARASGARFAIHHGDVMGDDLSLLESYRDILHETGMPWRHCPGNHDMDLSSLDSGHAFETWKRVIGPTHSAFQCGRATFLQLNNVEYLGPHSVAGSGERYRGMISDTQLSFVRGVLAHVPADHLVVVSTHIPFASFDAPKNPSTVTANWQLLLDTLSQHPNAVSFSGHSHTT